MPRLWILLNGLTVSARDELKNGKQKRPTINDIAHMSDVSIATVSYVLSNRPGVNISTETRRRVIESARQVGYKRNGLAAALRTGRLNTVAIVCPLPMPSVSAIMNHTYLNNAIMALMLAATHRGMNGVMFLDRETQRMDPRQLADGRADGAVILCAYDMPSWVEAVIETGLPCVEIGTSFGPQQVHTDNVGGAVSAVKHLVELGHKRIAHLAGASRLVSSRERHMGFKLGSRQAGLSDANSPVASDIASLKELMTGPDRPTAVFCYNDQLAWEAAKLFREMGLSIPKDVSLVGFDNDLRAVTMDPPLTTVQNPLDEIAAEALRLVSDQISAGDISSTPSLITTNLVIRASTAPPSIQ